MAFTDSDYAGSVEDRRTTSSYVFMLCGVTVVWFSRKQPIVTLSTTEVKFVVDAGSSCQTIWMQRMLKKIGYKGSESAVIYCDNNSTIKLSRNLVMHGKSKHIDMCYHF